MNKSNIYFLRHPETTWNVEQRFQGSKEGEITRKGQTDSIAFVGHLDLPKVDYIYHAENKRTKYLATLLHKKYPNAIISSDARLNERHGGDFEGKLYSEIYSEDENIGNYDSRYIWSPPNGESHKEVSYRANSFINELFLKHNDGEVVICVSSSGVIRNILHIHYNLSLEEMYKLHIPNLYLIRI
jgi:broad specificity phosphatase PhoE